MTNQQQIGLHGGCRIGNPGQKIPDKAYFIRGVAAQGTVGIPGEILERSYPEQHHKKYEGTTFFLSVYDDQLTIWNPGGLPDDLTMEQLKNKHRSIPRNRLIADVFFMAGYIEAWGRGIEVMQEGCREYGIPDPVIVEEQGGVEVAFLKDIYIEENLRKYGLEERHIKALFFTKGNGRITNSEYQKLFNVSKRTVSNDLQLLMDKKLLNKMGTTGRGTYYVLQRGKKGAKVAIKGQ